MKKILLLLLLIGVALSTFASAKKIGVTPPLNINSSKNINTSHKRVPMYTYIFPLPCANVVTITSAKQLGVGDYISLYLALTDALCAPDPLAGDE